MEWFVQVIVAGGIALVGGLWFVTVLEAWSPAWMGSLALALVGTAGLAVGIWTEIEY